MSVSSPNILAFPTLVRSRKEQRKSRARTGRILDKGEALGTVNGTQDEDRQWKGHTWYQASTEASESRPWYWRRRSTPGPSQPCPLRLFGSRSRIAHRLAFQPWAPWRPSLRPSVRRSDGGASGGETRALRAGKARDSGGEEGGFQA